MQTAGNFVRGGVELSARVQLCHHDLCGGNFFAIDVHVIDRNAAAVVDYRDGIVDVDADLNFVRVAGESFVDRIVNNFVDQVMESEFAGRADVHGGAFAHGF